MNKQLKHHLVSAALTFTTVFLPILALQIGQLSAENVTGTTILAAIVVALRATAKVFFKI